MQQGGGWAGCSRYMKRPTVAALHHLPFRLLSSPALCASLSFPDQDPLQECCCNLGDMGSPGVQWTVVSLLALLLVTVSANEELKPEGPREEFKSEGGMLEVWSHDFEVFKDANVGAARITLKQNGLALPKYADAASLAYVLQGSARLGLVLPWGESQPVRRVKRGDVIAIPRGVPTWWYNDGNEDFRAFAVADTSEGIEPGQYNSFFLAGAKEKRVGGILHAFSRDLLAEAWDVKEDVVKRLLEGQRGSAIIKVKEHSSIPEVNTETDAENGYFGDFRYNVDETDPDVQVPNGGEVSIVNRFKMPILKHVRLGAARVRLSRDAIFAPSYSLNAHKVMYITKGSGRVQVGRNDGEQAFDGDVKEGDLLVIPKFFPSIKKASGDGFEWILILTNDCPISAFLAGRNSIFKGMPVPVLAAAFNIDEDLERHIRERRREQAVIMPPRGKGVGSSSHNFEQMFFGYLEETGKLLQKQ